MLRMQHHQNGIEIWVSVSTDIDVGIGIGWYR